MRTQEERIKQLHERANEIEKRNDKIKTSGLGAFCVGIIALLVTCIVGASRAFHSTAGIRMQGASLLDNSAGGYVLVAVLAFYVGIIITAIIIKKRNNKSKN